MTGQVGTVKRGLRRWVKRGPLENVASIVIGLGIVMLAQPFSLELYSYSFITILVGTVSFMVVSHFPR